jgi:hypothetical protein
MTENIDHSRDGSSDPGSRAPAPPAVAAPSLIARRRRFLTGGAVAGATVVTLSSRSALAACTISGMISGFGSAAHRTKPAAGACGATPACWASVSASSWTSAGFNKTTSTLTTGLLPPNGTFNDQFGTGGTADFSITGTATLLNFLNNAGGANVRLTFTEKSGGGSAVLTIPNGFMAQYVAAFLNHGLFDGTSNDFYNHTQAAIIAVLAAIQTAGINATVTGLTSQQAANARETAASNAVSAQTSMLTTWNDQGGSTC